MEKWTPHCRLSIVKELVQNGKIRTTKTALEGAAALSMDFDGVVEVVMALTSDDFYKSMTTYDDHTLWHDVYRPSTPSGEVYLKLMVVDDVLIVSFKEL